MSHHFDVFFKGLRALLLNICHFQVAILGVSEY